MSRSTQTQELTLEKPAVGLLCQLIIYNDDVNTFDFVIDTLVEVCGHDLLQAEQCTLLIHYTGKCSVKVGEFSELEPLCVAILDRGLSAEIQESL